MDNSRKLNNEITNHLAQLNTKQKKAVLAFIQSLLKEEGYEGSDDSLQLQEIEARYDSIIKKEKRLTWRELDRRAKELESGKVRGITFESLLQGARESYKNRKKK